MREAACWAHLRRDFHDVWTTTKSEIAREALDRIGALYDIEREITGQSAEQRKAVRQKLSRPKVEALKLWAEAQLGRIPGKGEHDGYQLQDERLRQQGTSPAELRDEVQGGSVLGRDPLHWLRQAAGASLWHAPFGERAARRI